MKRNKEISKSFKYKKRISFKFILKKIRTYSLVKTVCLFLGAFIIIGVLLLIKSNGGSRDAFLTWVGFLHNIHWVILASIVLVMFYVISDIVEKKDDD